MFSKLFSKLPNSFPRARLYYRDGSSDKEYHVAINQAAGGFTVTFAYGRRGTALAAGTKTTSPVPLEKAQQIYDKLIAEKTAKGYTPHGSGALFALTENANRTSGLHPQLLNSVDEEAAKRYLVDDAWCLQEKFDGKRIMVVVRGGIVEGSNRKGLYVSLPQEVVDSLLHLPDCELDGELLGEAYVVFDLLRLDHTDLRPSPYHTRNEVLVDLLSVSLGPGIRVAETAWTAAEKWAFYERIAAADGEGVVFKKVNALSVPGRPASGGSQVKCKFYATCTCLVSAQNDQRSVRLSLLDAAGNAVGIGNVTIPSNQAVPQSGTLVEVRYLYAYKGGSLYQATYLGERDDIEKDACTLEQLKYKPEGYAAEMDP